MAYTADPATEKVTYIDDATGEEMPTLDTTIDGYTGMKGTYDVTVPNNYVLGQGQSAEVAYTMQPGETALTVHLNHMIVDGTQPQRRERLRTLSLVTQAQHQRRLPKISRGRSFVTW